MSFWTIMGHARLMYFSFLRIKIINYKVLLFKRYLYLRGCLDERKHMGFEFDLIFLITSRTRCIHTPLINLYCFYRSKKYIIINYILHSFKYSFLAHRIRRGTEVIYILLRLLNILFHLLIFWFPITFYYDFTNKIPVLKVFEDS